MATIALASLSAAVGLLAGCASGTGGGTIPAPILIQFNASEAGGLPPGFSTALTGGGGLPLWVVRPDPTAPGGFALRQESADDTSYRFPLCIYDAASARDVAVEVKFKAISGHEDQAGGLVLRYQPGNYYIARANALENNVNLFKTVNGQRSLILGIPTKVTAGEWHTLRFEATGRRLVVRFDGKAVIETYDDTFSGPGQVGLWTKADSVTAFADFLVEPAKSASE